MKGSKQAFDPPRAADAAPEGESADDSLPQAPRCVRDELEEALFAQRRDLFTPLNLVFFDTTSHYFHGVGGETPSRRWKSKDFRPQCKQVILGLTVYSTSRPLCTEILPGNTADVTMLLPVAERLRDCFAMPALCVVADRGRIIRRTLETRGRGYVLEVRVRNKNEFREQVLGEYADPARREHAVREETLEKLRERLSQCLQAMVGDREFKRHGED